jgi:hypothetical protein
MNASHEEFIDRQNRRVSERFAEEVRRNSDRHMGGRGWFRRLITTGVILWMIFTENGHELFAALLSLAGAIWWSQPVQNILIHIFPTY